MEKENKAVVYSENSEVTAVPAFDTPQEEQKHHEQQQPGHKAPVFSENGEVE